MSGPVIAKSGDVLPLPPPVGGSLLVIPEMVHTGAGSHVSCATAMTVTGTNLWLGGQSTLGATETEEITGGVVSRTLTTELQLFEFPEASVTLQVKGSVPIGKVDPDAGTQLGVPMPGQLSEADVLRVTIAPAGLVGIVYRSYPVPGTAATQ